MEKKRKKMGTSQNPFGKNQRRKSVSVLISLNVFDSESFKKHIISTDADILEVSQSY